MNFMQGKKRLLAMLLLASMALCMTGCDAQGTMMGFLGDMLPTVEPGHVLSGTTWINSDLYGSIDESTQLRLEDDFHTTVNRDWILEQSGGEYSVSSFNGSAEIVEERMTELIRPSGTFTADPEVMSQEEMEHLEYLISTMIELAGNQAKRDELGVEPLRPYIEAIEKIETLDDLTAYMADVDGMNFINRSFVTIGVDSGISSHDMNLVHVVPNTKFILDTEYDYYSIGSFAYTYYHMKQDAVANVLGKLGYSAEEAAEMVRNAYWLEFELADELPEADGMHRDSYKKHADNIISREKLEKLQGKFPLTQLLDLAGMSNVEEYLVYETNHVRVLGKLYKDSNLESMKDWYIVHTVLEALPMLDSESLALSDALVAASSSNEIKNRNYDEQQEDEEGDVEDEAEEEDVAPNPFDIPETDGLPDGLSDKELDIFVEYLNPYLNEVMQQLYIARYCSSETKEQVIQLIADVVDYYKVMLRETDWLSQATIDKAVEKLEAMGIWAVYPDELKDFGALVYADYSEGGNLLDAVNAVCDYNNSFLGEKAGTVYDKKLWDLNSAPVTTINAENLFQINNMVIYDGIISDGFLFSPDNPIEVNYAHLGVIIGHEITHSFDTLGYKYDKDGIEKFWWTPEDEVVFRAKSDKLANHYKAMNAMPVNDTMYDGDRIAGEVIADMGGMKCMLGLAKEIEDFDYELFFRSYAQLWRVQYPLLEEITRYQSDPHPLCFLRTNVTVQQFDEFYETFDIGPGDGMYLAPEKRIAVW